MTLASAVRWSHRLEQRHTLCQSCGRFFYMFPIFSLFVLLLCRGIFLFHCAGFRFHDVRTFVSFWAFFRFTKADGANLTASAGKILYARPFSSGCLDPTCETGVWCSFQDSRVEGPCWILSPSGLWQDFPEVEGRPLVQGPIKKLRRRHPF